MKEVYLKHSFFLLCLDRVSIQIATELDWYLWDKFVDNTACITLEIVINSELGRESKL